MNFLLLVKIDDKCSSFLSDDDNNDDDAAVEDEDARAVTIVLRTFVKANIKNFILPSFLNVKWHSVARL